MVGRIFLMVNNASLFYPTVSSTIIWPTKGTIILVIISFDVDKFKTGFSHMTLIVFTSLYYFTITHC